MRITEPDKIDTYYKALLERDSQYIGVFYVGVKTTSVFCISTCRARKPKFQNVEFFSTFKGAMDYGYRPCKVCKPTENANEAPTGVETAISLVRDNPKEKITDQMLREAGISPENIRRWFNHHYGMTFHCFQRMYRINNALDELKKGQSTLAAAYDAGYQSLSGFGYTYKKLLGQSPKNNGSKNVILISRLTTPIGPMFVCATDTGICLLEFVDRKMLETEFKDVQKKLNAQILAGENHHTIQLAEELAEYFDGTRKVFSVPLHTPGTEFQNIVWRELTSIPFGNTRSYQEQAKFIGRPSAVRAVASANGMNRISIVIPCHRVIGKNGELTGYGGGLERKRWLLDHEQKYFS